MKNSLQRRGGRNAHKNRKMLSKSLSARYSPEYTVCYSILYLELFYSNIKIGASISSSKQILKSKWKEFAVKFNIFDFYFL